MKYLLRNVAMAALVSLAVVGPAAAQTLTGAGATFPYPIYSKWFDMYKQKTGVEINYQSIGSGGGIQQVKAGTVDFGASDAALSNDRLKEMPRKVVQLPDRGRSAGDGLQPAGPQRAAQAHAGSHRRGLHGQGDDCGTIR